MSLSPNAFEQVMRQTETHNISLQYTTPCFLVSVLRDVQHVIEAKQSTCASTSRTEREKRGLLNCLIALFAATSHAIHVILHECTITKVTKTDFTKNNIL